MEVLNDISGQTDPGASLAPADWLSIHRRLGNQIRERAVIALRQGDLTQARRLLERLLPQCAVTLERQVWQECLTSLGASLPPWPVRRYLLPRLAEIEPLRPDGHPGPQARAWLHLSTEELGELFQSPAIPRPYLVWATLQNLSNPEALESAILDCLAPRADVAGRVLRALASRPVSLPRATLLFAELLRRAAAPLLDVLVGEPEFLPVSILRGWLAVVWELAPEALQDLVRRHGARLAEPLANCPALAALAGLYWSRPCSEWLHEPGIFSFLRDVHQRASLTLDPRVELRRQAVLTVGAFLHDGPAAVPLEEITLALRRFPRDGWLWALEQVLLRLVRDWLARPREADLTAEVEAVLGRFASANESGPGPLYDYLVEMAATSPEFWHSGGLLRALLAVGAGAGRDRSLAEALGVPRDRLEFLADGLAHRRLGERLSALTQASSDWPEPARQCWQKLSVAAVRRLLASRLRDPASDPQEVLEEGLDLFGAFYPGGSAAFYRDLLRGLGRRDWFWHRFELCQAFVAVAVRQYRRPALETRLPFLEREARWLAARLGRRGPAAWFRALDEAALDWSDETRQRWLAVALPYRPRGRYRRWW